MRRGSVMDVKVSGFSSSHLCSVWFVLRFCDGCKLSFYAPYFMLHRVSRSGTNIAERAIIIVIGRERFDCGFRKIQKKKRKGRQDICTTGLSGKYGFRQCALTRGLPSRASQKVVEAR